MDDIMYGIIINAVGCQFSVVEHMFLENCNFIFEDKSKECSLVIFIQLLHLL